AFGLPDGAATLLTWGGLRGGLSLAMALALPAGVSRDVLGALAYAVVAFAILVQGSTFARLVRGGGRR
ncbi:MAG TPA: sodium:proton antiporter, partial [Burkholderiaceae bacterium]